MQKIEKQHDKSHTSLTNTTFYNKEMKKKNLRMNCEFV